MTRKKLITTLLIALFAISSVFAQESCNKMKTFTHKDGQAQAFGRDFYYKKCMCLREGTTKQGEKEVIAFMKYDRDNYVQFGGKASDLGSIPTSCKMKTNGSGSGSSSGSSNKQVYSDPNQVIKSTATDLFNELAKETDNEQIKQIAKNYNNVKEWSDAFKKMDPDNAEAFSKIEDISMVISTITPFIFKTKESEAEKLAKLTGRRSSLAEADSRTKKFEKDVIREVLNLKKQLIISATKEDKEYFNKLYRAYLVLLNTPISMYMPDELFYQFYADMNIYQDWRINLKENPYNNKVEQELSKYYFNTTIGNIYYGTNEYSAKKLLDLLMYHFSQEEVDNNEIMSLLLDYRLFEKNKMFDYQPFLFALNRSYAIHDTVFFNSIWNVIEYSYKKEKNTVDDILVNTDVKQEKVGAVPLVRTYNKINNSQDATKQKKYLKSINYGVKKAYGNVGPSMTTNSYKGIIKSLNFAILKKRRDFLIGEPIDNKYDYDNIFFTYTALPYSKQNMRFYPQDNISQAYFYQLVMEDIYNNFEYAIKNNDVTTYSKEYKEFAKSSTQYSKLTSASHDRNKSNYFRPTYHQETTVDYISSQSYLNNARAIVRYHYRTDVAYNNPAFQQDFKLVLSRLIWYDAMLPYMKTGSEVKVNDFKNKYKDNAFVQLEWLIAFGKVMK